LAGCPVEDEPDGIVLGRTEGIDGGEAAQVLALEVVDFRGGEGEVEAHCGCTAAG
jgi:hypothetical protein